MTKLATDKLVAPPPPPRGYRTTPVFTPYVVICTMFGALSVGYMAIALSAPDWLDDLTPTISMEAPADVGQDVADRLASEIGALRDGLAQLQSDMTTVRADVDATRARQSAVEREIASLDLRTAGLAVANSADPAAMPPSDAAPPQTPKVINSGAKPAPAAALETGSVGKTIATAAAPAPSSGAQPSPTPAAPAIPSFGPAVIKPEPEPLGVRLSSADSIDSLRANWAILSENYGKDLKKLQPRYVINSDPAKPGFDLVVGPVKSKSEAQKLCKALAAGSVPCKVSDFIGNAL